MILLTSMILDINIMESEKYHKRCFAVFTVGRIKHFIVIKKFYIFLKYKSLYNHMQERFDKVFTK